MKKLAISSAILSILSFGAMAESPSFNFVEVGYTDGFGSDTLDGFEVNGSFELNDSFYLSANYMNSSESDDGSEVDLNGYFFGIGYKAELSENSTWFSQLDYVNIDAELEFNGSTFSDSENGYQITTGIRNNISDNVELSAAISFIDVVESDTYATFGAVYNLTDQAGLYMNIDTDFSDSSYGVGLRMSF